MSATTIATTVSAVAGAVGGLIDLVKVRNDRKKIQRESSEIQQELIFEELRQRLIEEDRGCVSTFFSNLKLTFCGCGTHLDQRVCREIKFPTSPYNSGTSTPRELSFEIASRLQQHQRRNSCPPFPVGMTGDTKQVCLQPITLGMRDNNGPVSPTPRC